MVKVNEHNLLQALTVAKLEGKVQQETNQIFVLFEHEGQEFPLFIRQLHDGELLQFLTFIPCPVDPSRVNEICRFLHLLNKELDMPGFCYDETSMTIFYRLMLPTLNKEFNQDVLEAYLNTSQMICKSFGPAIFALATGVMTLDEIMKKANELKTT